MGVCLLNLARLFVAKCGRVVKNTSMELQRTTTDKTLASYLQQHHEALAVLLPSDTTCNDLFCQVENGDSIGKFFSKPAEEAAESVDREFLRLGRRRGVSA